MNAKYLQQFFNTAEKSEASFFFCNTEKPTVVSFAVSTQTTSQVSSFSTSDHRDQTSGKSVENQTQANQLSQVSHYDELWAVPLTHTTHETRMRLVSLIDQKEP